MENNNSSIKLQEKTMVRMASVCRNRLEVDNEIIKCDVMHALEEIAEAVGSDCVDKKLMKDFDQQTQKEDFKGEWGKLSDIKKLLMLCKQNAVMPYYLTKITAYIFYCAYNENLDNKINSLIDNDGIKAALKESLALSIEPQLLEWINMHYKKIQTSTDFCEDNEKIEKIREAYKKGFLFEKNYGGCAQCVIAALCEMLGVEKEPLFTTSTMLNGGGCSRTDGSCGAYSGSLMFLSRYVLGRSFENMMNEDKEIYKKSANLGTRINQKFIDTYGTVICREIHRCIFGRMFRLWDKDDHKKFIEAGAHESKCPGVVGLACAWVMEILLEEKQKPVSRVRQGVSYAERRERTGD